MLFTEDELYKATDPFQILDRAIYLTEEETKVYPNMIPVLQTNLGNIIPYHYLEQFANGSDKEFSLQEALLLISEANEVDIDSLVVALDESDVILEPELMKIHESIVVVPESVYSHEFNYVLEALELWEENGYDDNILLEFFTAADFSLMKSNIPKNLDTGLKILG